MLLLSLQEACQQAWPPAQATAGRLSCRLQRPGSLCCCLTGPEAACVREAATVAETAVAAEVEDVEKDLLLWNRQDLRVV